MKVKMTNRCVYTIPDVVLATCKHIEIIHSHIDRLSRVPHIRHVKGESVFKHNEEALVDYIHIGMENIDDNIERHWFVRKSELRQCRCDPD